MASTSGQEEFLAVIRKSQEAVISAVRNLAETVRTASPKLASVYAPLTDNLPKPPSVSVPFRGQAARARGRAPVAPSVAPGRHARQPHTTAAHIRAIRGAAGDLCPCPAQRQGSIL